MAETFDLLIQRGPVFDADPAALKHANLGRYAKAEFEVTGGMRRVFSGNLAFADDAAAVAV